MKNGKLPKSILAMVAIALVVPCVALAQEWTPDKDQRIR